MKSTHTRLNVEDIPGTATVPAGGNVLLSAEYEALSESASEGDIVATAVFTENMTGRQLTNETTLTAVRVEVVAQAEFPPAMLYGRDGGIMGAKG